MGAHDHKTHAEREAPARCAILTVTDSKTRETDTSGRLAFEILTRNGHSVIEHEILPNDRHRIAESVERSFRHADLVVTIGGTGVSRKDVTVEAVRPLLEKELPGFGEMFRAKSAERVGTAALMTRALLGVTSSGKIVVCLPGSEGGVRVALEGILVNELKHLVWELRRHA